MVRLHLFLSHMQTALQQFAWTERRRLEQLKARAVDSSKAGGLANEPMFCFEAAVWRHPGVACAMHYAMSAQQASEGLVNAHTHSIPSQVKLLYWSILVYELEEASVSAAELKADRNDQLLEVHAKLLSLSGVKNMCVQTVCAAARARNCFDAATAQQHPCGLACRSTLER